MTDLGFIVAAYVITVGGLVAYIASLRVRARH
jgi:hypothetical protein